MTHLFTLIFFHCSLSGLCLFSFEFNICLYEIAYGYTLFSAFFFLFWYVIHWLQLNRVHCTAWKMRFFVIFACYNLRFSFHVFICICQTRNKNDFSFFLNFSPDFHWIPYDFLPTFPIMHIKKLLINEIVSIEIDGKIVINSPHFQS